MWFTNVPDSQNLFSESQELENTERLIDHSLESASVERQPLWLWILIWLSALGWAGSIGFCIWVVQR